MRCGFTLLWICAGVVRSFLISRERCAPAEGAESLARLVGLLLWPAQSFFTRSAVAGCVTALFARARTMVKCHHARTTVRTRGQPKRRSFFYLLVCYWPLAAHEREGIDVCARNHQRSE